MNNRVAVALPRLPEEARRLGVTVRKQSPELTLVANLFSPDGSRDSLFLSNFALINVLDSLKRVPGVGDVNIFGERRYAMRIWLDPERLAKLGLTASDVIDAVREQNVQIAAGRAGSPPAPDGVQLEIPLRTEGRLSTVEEFEQIVIRAEPGGSLLHLGDVARVELGAQSYAGFARLTGQPAVTLGVFQLPEANALEVSQGIRAELKRLSENFPSGVEQMVRYDPTQFVAESISEVMRTLFAAIVLVFLVVYVFLEDWRATLIPAVTIPVSLVGTFAVLYAIGFGINTITLFALVLAIGLVVDDAIVVVENVARLLSAGYSRREAVLRSMGEVTSAIVASTLVLGAVFAPVALLPGTTGLLLRNFGVTVTVRRADLAAQRAHALAGAVRARDAPRTRAQVGVLPRLRPRLLGGGRALRPQRARAVSAPRARDRRARGAIRAEPALVPVGSHGLHPGRRPGLLHHELPAPRRRFARTHRRGGARGRADPEGNAGSEGVQSVRRLRHADRHLPAELRLGARHAGAVGRTRGKGAGDRRDLRARAAAIRGDSRGARVRAQSLAGPRALPGRRLRVPAPGPRRRNDRASSPRSRSGSSRRRRAVPELQNLLTSFRPYAPQVRVDLDRTKAKTLGVQVDEVFETLQAFMGGTYVNDFDRFGRLFRVYAQAEGDLRTSPEDVKRLWVRSERGEMVPMSTLISLERISGPRDIPHYNVYRVGADPGRGGAGLQLRPGARQDGGDRARR